MRRSLIVSMMAVLLTLTGTPLAGAAEPPGILGVRIHLDPPPAQVPYGGKATLRGILEYETSIGWEGFADQRVGLVVGDTVHDLRTAQGGAFQKTVTLRTTGDVYATARVKDIGAFNSESYTVSVPPPPKRELKVAFSLFKMDGWGELLYDADWTDISNGQAPYALLEFSRDKRSWKVVDRLDLGNLYKGARVRNGRVNGYWRLHYPGDQMYAEGYSEVRHIARSKVAFRSVKVTPRRVRPGGKATITGTLHRITKKIRRPYARVKVSAVYRCLGKRTWYVNATTRTDSKGRFAMKVPARCDSNFAVFFPGNSATWAQMTKEIRVDTSR